MSVKLNAPREEGGGVRLLYSYVTVLKFNIISSILLGNIDILHFEFKSKNNFYNNLMSIEHELKTFCT